MGEDEEKRVAGGQVEPHFERRHGRHHVEVFLRVPP
jgi:hypothetical protein